MLKYIRYMKLVREYINEKFTDESDPIKDLGIGMRHKIEEWLDEMRVINYTINKDLTIDVISPNYVVDFSNKKLTNFPFYIQFNNVEAGFEICRNMFTSLRGCPKKISGFFRCEYNMLSSLEGCPKELHKGINPHANFTGAFYCHNNTKQFSKMEVLYYCNVIEGESQIYV